MFNCWKCDTSIDLPPASRVGTRDSCPKCDADLHSCRNCRFYDTSKNNQCAEPQAEWVRDKEASNYCDYFSPNPVGVHGHAPLGGSTASRDRSRTAPSSPAENAKKKFDSLFKI